MAYKKSAETRQRIIEATKKLFIRKGYYNTTIKEIAAEAHIIHSSIYYYFRNKEAIARVIFDIVAEKIILARDAALEADPDRLTNTILTYILTFKYLALNKATQAVYYDMVQYANYDKVNLERVQRTFYGTTKTLFDEYGIPASDKRISAYILTSDAFAKALFKGIINGLLDFSLEEAMDYFCRHMLMSDIHIPDKEYREKLQTAFRISEGIDLDKP